MDASSKLFFLIHSCTFFFFLGCYIAGDIPKEICDLPKLNILSLGGNELSGQIPREIGRLNMLQKLELRHSSLEGKLFWIIFYL